MKKQGRKESEIVWMQSVRVDCIKDKYRIVHHGFNR